MSTAIIENLNRHLPPHITAIVRLAGAHAQRLGLALYLVGGIVRDMLLDRPILDIDLVIDGDIMTLAQNLADNTRAKLISHRRFGTAKLKYPDFTLDLVMARGEKYPRPGALPEVHPRRIEQDLFRRDFAINAMALSLNPGSYGTLLDPYGGKSDLEAGIIRTLHPDSFLDDPTRIWRAVRYEQRLGFRIEPATLRQLYRSLAMLNTISADRLRHEIERVLDEETPERIFQRAWKLGVLQQVHPSLKADRWLSAKYHLARRTTSTTSLKTVYLALLAYRLNPDECESFLSRLNLSAHTARVVRDTLKLRQLSHELTTPNLKPSRIYELVNNYDTVAVNATILATKSATERKHLSLYLNRLRHVRVSLSGYDLQTLGVPDGPALGIMLQELLAARIDGKIRNRRDEEAFVHRRLIEFTP